MCNNLANSFWVDKTFNTVITKTHTKSSNVLSTLELLNTFLLTVFSTHHKSAYHKHHFTEAAFLYIHDHLINAIGSQKISCLCLLDHSVAFGIIDHNILITHLGLGLVFTGLSWNGLSLTCLIAVFVSNVKTVFQPLIPALVVFPKVLFLVLFFSSCIPLRA